jgi:transcriptional regulator with XRE-family HTH domain
MEDGYGARMHARERFGRAVRQLRQQRGWSIEVLAAKAGINDKYLGAVERGQQAASLDIVERIATGLRVELHELFVQRDLSTKELRARAATLLKEASDDTLRRVIAVLETMLH